MSDIVSVVGLGVLILIVASIPIGFFNLVNKFWFYRTESGKYLKHIKKTWKESSHPWLLCSDSEYGTMRGRFSSSGWCRTTLTYEDVNGIIRVELDPVGNPFGTYSIDEFTIECVPEKYQYLFARELHRFVQFRIVR